MLKSKANQISINLIPDETTLNKTDTDFALLSDFMHGRKKPFFFFFSHLVSHCCYARNLSQEAVSISRLNYRQRMSAPLVCKGDLNFVLNRHLGKQKRAETLLNKRNKRLHGHRPECESGVMGIAALFEQCFQLCLVRIKCKGVNLCAASQGGKGLS